MKEWAFAQSNTAEELALLHHYSVKSRDVEFIITVREYASPVDPTMQFFATTNKQTNQSTAAFSPCGWGKTMLEALAECIRSIHRFPYEGPETES